MIQPLSTLGQVNSVMLSKVEDEIAYIIVQIKKYNESLNISSFYKTQCNKEFLRRILFRVLETMDFQRRGWGWSYGISCKEEMIRELLDLQKGDILIQEPIKLNIKGDDLFLAVVLALAPFIAPLPAYALLTFMAFLQGFIFMILTYVYIAGAVVVEEH